MASRDTQELFKFKDLGDGTFAVFNWIVNNVAVKLYDSLGNAISSTLRGSKQALTVELVDADGNQITDFGGSGGGIDPVGLKTIAGATINPATSDNQLPDDHNVTVSNIANVPVITGFATETNQTDGTQKTQIVTSLGAVVDSFGTDPVGIKNGADATINPATEETLDSLNTLLDTISSAIATIQAQTDKLTFNVSDHLEVNDNAGGGVDPVGLKDSGGVTIDPATEDTLRNVAVKLNPLSFDLESNLNTKVKSSATDPVYASVATVTSITNQGNYTSVDMANAQIQSYWWGIYASNRL